MHFTESKFLGLKKRQQHKKSAELLRNLYRDLNSNSLLNQYNEVQSWMSLPLLSNLDLKNVSNRYHYHLEKAEIKLKEHRLLPNVSTEDRQSGETAWPIAIYMDNIRSAHNIGSIIRTTEATRLGSLYFSDTMAFIDNKQVKDTAMGAEQWVSCQQTKGTAELPHPIIAMETSSEAIPLCEFTFPESFTLVLGNEEYGCSESSLSAAHHLVNIPLRGRKNSLNVANAFAIVAGEILRQKSLNPSEEKS